jgi:hypothetical protein
MGSAMNGPDVVCTITAFSSPVFRFNKDFSFGASTWFESDNSTDNLELLLWVRMLRGLMSFCEDTLDIFSVHKDKHVMRQVESICATKTGSSFIS